MIVFNAGIPKFPAASTVWLVPRLDVLLPFSYVDVTESWLNDETQPRHLFVDCGAPTAFLHGMELRIEEYITFLHKWKHLLYCYCGLDVIGDPETTYKNQKIMEGEGLTPLPTLHFGEPAYWEDKYFEEYDWLALGGTIWSAGGEREAWFDRILLNSDGSPSHPDKKVHGFGIGNTDIMIRYPWHSVDSTVVLQATKTGETYFPGILFNKPDAPLVTVYLGNAHALADSGYSHEMRKRILEHIENAGYDPYELMTQYQLKCEWNLLAFSTLAEKIEALKEKRKGNEYFQQRAF